MAQNLHPRTHCGAFSRTLRTTLAALLLAAPITLQAQQRADAQEEIIHGIADEVGQTYQQLYQNASPNGEHSHTDKTKVFFLYNVRTGKFLNMGGYWGVHVSLMEYPLALWTDKEKNTRTDVDVINFRQDASSTQGQYLLWANSSGAYKEDNGVFADRGANATTDGYAGWILELATKADGTAYDTKNTYRLYTYTTADGTGQKMYLSAIGTETDVDKNCGARTQAELEAGGDWDEGSLWRIISLEQVYKMQDLNTEDFTEPLDMTWKLECGGFSRILNDIQYWKMYCYGANPTAALVRFGLEKMHDAYRPQVTQTTTTPVRQSPEKYLDADGNRMQFQGPYTFPAGEEGETVYTNENNYLRHLSKYFCGDVRATHGIIFQDQKITHAGTFIIQCKAYSSAPDARLFAGVVDADDANQVYDWSLRTSQISQISAMPEEERQRLHTDEKNMDYAGKEFYASRQYLNSVVVQVPEASEDNPATIRFGIMVGDARTKETPDPEEWTVFDEFRMLYASDAKHEDLVLDELRANVDYLKQATTYTNRTLHLKKKFTLNKWNSFVLPVGLTARQITTTFGASCRLAKLARIEGTEIQFETVNLVSRAEYALEPYVPYIIFPTTELLDDANPAYTATITHKVAAGEEARTEKVVVEKNHYDIPFVTLQMNKQNENDLTNMHNHGVSKLTVETTDGSLTAYGTFVRTFDPEATQQTTDKKADDYGTWTFSARNGEIRTDYNYDNLQGSYFFDQGRMYYSDTRSRGLRGFSCWFKPTTTQAQQVQPTIYIDGIKQEGALTAVGELLIGPDATADLARPRGVYTLQGQRMGDTTDGLPAGLYIVDGVKRVVK